MPSTSEILTLERQSGKALLKDANPFSGTSVRDHGLAFQKHRRTINLSKHQVGANSFNEKLRLKDLLKMPETHEYCSKKAKLSSEEKRRNQLPRKYLSRPCTQIFNFKPRFTTPQPVKPTSVKVTPKQPSATRLKLAAGRGCHSKRTQKLLSKQIDSK